MSLYGIHVILMVLQYNYKRRRQTTVLYKPHLLWQYSCWSFKYSWSITCRRCSNYILILDFTPGFNELDIDNCNTRRETFEDWDLVRLLLEGWLYLWMHIWGKQILEYDAAYVYIMVEMCDNSHTPIDRAHRQAHGQSIRQNKKPSHIFHYIGFSVCRDHHEWTKDDLDLCCHLASFGHNDWNTSQSK